MRVLQVISSVSPRLGGPAEVVLSLNTSYLDREVDAYALSVDYAGRGNEPLTDRERSELFARTRALRIFRRSRPYFFQGSWSMFQFLLARTSHFDVVEMHGQYLLPHVYAYVASKLARRPYVIFPHGTLEPYQLSQSRAKKLLYDLIVGRRIVKNAARVIFADVSEAERASARIKATQQEVVPLGLALEPPEALTEWQSAFAGRSRAECILFLGRLARKKRPDILLRAWARLGQLGENLLVIAGPDDYFSRAELGRMAADLGIADSVIFPGEVTGGRKTWLYDQCGTFVLPSENENFGMTVTEALSRGCLVVSTAEVAAFRYAEQVDWAERIFRLDEVSVASSIEQAISRQSASDERQRRQEAQEFASSSLGWPRAAEDLVQIYASVSRKRNLIELGRAEDAGGTIMDERIPVTVLVQTKNEEKSIARCLQALRNFAEVIVVDSNSDDATQEISRSFGATVVNFTWNGLYPKKKQWQLDNVPTKHDWVLFLDADELPSAALQNELLRKLPPAGRTDEVAFDVCLDYKFAGRVLQHGHRVKKRALVRRDSVKFPEVDDLDVPGMGELEGHYQPHCLGPVGRLEGRIFHDDQDPIRTWFDRHNKYSDWEASLVVEDDRRRRLVAESRSSQGKLFDAVPMKPLAFFCYSYLARLGFLDGRAGFDYAVALATYYWQIGLKVREARRQK